MNLIISKQEGGHELSNCLFLVNKSALPNFSTFTDPESQFIKKQIDAGEKQVIINHYQQWSYVLVVEIDQPNWRLKEELRRASSKLIGIFKQNKHSDIFIYDLIGNKDAVLAITEGFALANYSFAGYHKNTGENKPVLNKIEVYSQKITQTDLDGLSILTEAVFKARNMVNEPVITMNTQNLTLEFIGMGKEAGFSVDVFDREKIESLGMGGLLGVNKGSVDPPAFVVMEWAPIDAMNIQPLVLVGKGVVFDTGGLSLKTTKDSMDYMKSDMSGAAIVASVMYSCARMKVPYHIIGLVPATDNRIGGNAYSPGDVLKMYNGLFVEVLNTDAEGRLILADALSYAGELDPFLVIELSTLTGSAKNTLGKYAIAGMPVNANEYFNILKDCGNEVYERIVEFPMWEEYGELIKSDIADLKNVGGAEAGIITAGKFLEHFTTYPFIHLDIAGVSFLSSQDFYRSKGGTGTGVRLLNEFINRLTKTEKITS